MLNQDLYGILGVQPSASEQEIRKAYRALAKKYHPDKNPDDKRAEQKFKEISLAYEVLKNPQKKAQYDQARTMGGAGFGGPGWGDPQGVNFSAEFFGDMGLGELFEEILGGRGMRAGGMGGRRHVRHGSFKKRGADQQASLTISFMEAARGGERVVSLPNGRRVTVKIPEGVDNGTKIKLGQQGEPGIGGGPPGDLIISLKVVQHPFFQREGSDIVLNLPITFSEAVLGAEIEIPTLEGKVHLKIPKGISGGKRLKLKGKGIENRRTQKRGDLLVELSVKLPKSPNANYKKAAELLEEESFDPRDGLF